jgi:hypothetical protein
MSTRFFDFGLPNLDRIWVPRHLFPSESRLTSCLQRDPLIHLRFWTLNTKARETPNSKIPSPTSQAPNNGSKLLAGAAAGVGEEIIHLPSAPPPNVHARSPTAASSRSCRRRSLRRCSSAYSSRRSRRTAAGTHPRARTASRSRRRRSTCVWPQRSASRNWLGRSGAAAQRSAALKKEKFTPRVCRRVDGGYSRKHVVKTDGWHVVPSGGCCSYHVVPSPGMRAPPVPRPWLPRPWSLSGIVCRALRHGRQSVLQPSQRRPASRHPDRQTDSVILLASLPHVPSHACAPGRGVPAGTSSGAWTMRGSACWSAPERWLRRARRPATTGTPPRTRSMRAPCCRCGCTRPPVHPILWWRSPGIAWLAPRRWLPAADRGDGKGTHR